MRFSIVGAGALGTILGAHLIEAGHDVRIIARGRRAEYLARNGLRVNGLRELALPCAPVTILDPGIDNDVLIYAVKTYHMEAALAASGGVAPRAVFSLANGVMKNEQLAAVFGNEAVLGCMANFSGELFADGTVNFTRNVCLFVGGQEPLASEIVSTIHEAGVVTVASDNIESVEWSKFVAWAAMFVLSLTARTTTGVYLENQRLAELAARLIREAAAVAAARKIELIDQSPMPTKSVAELPFPQAVAKIREIGREMHHQAPNHRMSSLQDLEAGRELEVHETIGYIAREAERLGISAPAIDLCYGIAAGLNELPR